MTALTQDQIRQLYRKYLDLAHMEIEEFGVRPTEARHLIGRLGEFHCAMHVDGTLATVANQQGFDVLDHAGRRISVKTTAQAAGFVAINRSTLGLADDLMVIRYAGGQLSTLYYGAMQAAVDVARYYAPDNHYELDIDKAVRLQSRMGGLPVSAVGSPPAG